MVKSYPCIYHILFLASCAGNNTNIIVFPKTTHLFVFKVHQTDIYMRYPYRIRSADSTLYVMDLHATDYFIHKLSDKDSTIHITSYGKRGEGPTELLDAENIRLDSRNRLWTLDANRHKLIMWDDCGQTELSLNPLLLRSLDFAFMNDSTFIIPDYTGQNRICLINENGDIIKQLFSIRDKRHHNTSRASLAQAWRSFIDYNQKTGLLAVATQLGQVIEVYDMKKEHLIASINIEKGSPQFSEKQNYAIPDGIMGYSDIHVSDNKIYALFWGHSFKDIQSRKINHEGGNRLQVFSTEGIPLKEYILDRYITGFCIDETNNRLIALDTNSDHPIIEYKISTNYDN